MSSSNDRAAAVRRSLSELRSSLTLRALSSSTGVSHVTLMRFLRGDEPRPATLAMIEKYLGSPNEAAAVKRLRDDLRRLTGALSVRKRREVEQTLARSLAKAFGESDLKVPGWISMIEGG